MMSKYIGVILIFASLFSTAQATPSLQAVNQQITKVQRELSKTQLQQTQQIALLRKTDISINQLRQYERQTNTALQRKQQAIKNLNRDIKQTKATLHAQQTLLAKQLRLRYQLGQTTYLKLLLSQTSPAHMQRLLMYLRKVNQARAQQLQRIKTQIIKLQTQQQQLAQQQQALQQLYQKQHQEQRHLQSAQRNQQQLIQQLRRHLQSQQAQLRTLQANKARLEAVLQRLPLQTFPNGKLKPFYQLRGKLAWPTRGQLRQPFGTQIARSRLTTTGILIAAPARQVVRAIYPGRVVFADWLKGYGLLLIIDHDGNYMSLYGHNDSLYKKLGDTVNSGEIIAEVGHSGGYLENGLYFEIRRKGKAVNPLKWLAAS